MKKTIFVAEYSYFRPSQENPSEMPKLLYVDSLFRRRLSQISRMTIEAVHGVAAGNEDAKLVFASFRGEIARQLKINKGLVEDAAVMPAQFSISVFNTPPAVATIALGLKNGYTAVYPVENSFRDALCAAVVPILCGTEKKIIFAYSDELVPAEYKKCCGYTEKMPVAFACVLLAERPAQKTGMCHEIDFASDGGMFDSPDAFLAFLASGAL